MLPLSRDAADEFSSDRRFGYNRSIGPMRRVLANSPVDWGSTPCRAMLNTQKILLDVALLSAENYKVRIKGKVEQSWELSSALP